jgi:hypothetical protein
MARRVVVLEPLGGGWWRCCVVWTAGALVSVVGPFEGDSEAVRAWLNERRFHAPAG